jgi:hypothetical protein
VTIFVLSPFHSLRYITEDPKGYPPRGRRHGEYREEHQEHFEHQEEVIVTRPVVVVHPPEIIVR